jgi:hypothetical protein
MAKRLTDTTKWTNKAFRKLPAKMKLLYLYILDNCDAAGVMNLDLDVIGFLLGDDFSLEEVKPAFEKRIIFLSDDKVIVRNYIAFQNGDVTDSKSNIAKSVISTLNSHGLLDRYKRGEFGHVNHALALWDS